MWRKSILAYFQYTKKERTGLFVLLGIVILLWLIPVFFSEKSIPVPEAEIVYLKNYQARESDSVSDGKDKQTVYTGSEHTNIIPVAQKLFPFDPNITSENDWRTLGLSEKTISVIRHYLEKGGRFRKPEDLKKVYGLLESDYTRLLPYVRIRLVSADASVHRFAPTTWDSSKTSGVVSERKFPNSGRKEAININKADPEAWESLRGIGQKLAERIVLFRDRLGGFHSIEQVGETYGISPELFAEIKSKLVVDKSFQINVININTAHPEILKKHPYIGYKLGNLIVNYRNEHAPFSSTEELRAIPLITDDSWKKMKPYLGVE